MRDPLPFGRMLSVQARLQPDRIGARDLERSMSFALWNRRACRFANALAGLGLRKGDRIAVLAYNCVEWLEIYAGAAKAGLVVVPVNFRFVAKEAAYVIADAECAALIAQADLLPLADEARATIPIHPDRFIRFGGKPAAGWRDYEDMLAMASDAEPEVPVAAEDPWTLMYTSGTTGNPKGVVRSHRVNAMLAYMTAIELAIRRPDDAMLVMPLCHANSVNFLVSFAYAGAATSVYSRRSFDPSHCLRALGETGATFTSLVPTHYILMLALSEAERSGLDLSHMAKLMISSAPARPDTKQAVMEMFPNSGLFELYGSSEAGWVTMLHPDEQFTHLGTVGRETVGSAPIRILDENGDEVPDGQPGELFSCNPYTFEGYWRLPEKTAEAFRGDYCSVGDMALRDSEGFIRLIDRKKNMIISGGENVYPSEVETVLGAHPAVMDVAVVGVPHATWGEAVHAVVVRHAGVSVTEDELIAWCRERMAGYKRPRSVAFIADAEMPRTATGKILHRQLRERFAASKV